MSVLKKAIEDRDVYEAALQRMRDAFYRFDRVVVSFSGGKDSTAVLNLALLVAEETGRLPLDVYFWDEEVLHPETIEYVQRVAKDPRVRFKWLCVPIQHRNACSRKEPYWYPWDPEKKDLWVREMPEGAITDVPGFYKGASVPELAHRVYGPESGTVADLRGLRADESLRRYRAVARRLNDNWIGTARDGYSYPCSPIYDWTTADVWTAPRLFHWDYNRTYDLMDMAGMRPDDQRVCPPYGEEPLKGLWIYREIWPDLWDKMLVRVPGVATAVRYAKTELYGWGKIDAPPKGLTWKQWAMNQLDLYPPEYRKVIAASLQTAIKRHSKQTARPVPMVKADPLTGISWRYLAMIVNRGDFKGRRLGNMTVQASNARKHGEHANSSMADFMDADDEDNTRY
jgi:predicted phosphoadenosine phosphosulfate sulfurtransferase